MQMRGMIRDAHKLAEEVKQGNVERQRAAVPAPYAPVSSLLCVFSMACIPLRAHLPMALTALCASTPLTFWNESGLGPRSVLLAPSPSYALVTSFCCVSALSCE